MLELWPSPNQVRCEMGELATFFFFYITDGVC